ncbi:putative zinc-type alcohol dehydrogenase-like protein [Rhodanobacter sp. ANJX3]|uniref:NAD(P)-dependent alcohol dehydrogenase n=1 Tax=Rhodanobacter sp. ANJX3 TaxID=2723083 RepID=UPI00160C44B3|nr:NAD(P)-dependent alcohol dehydrogenase [Rhodanobacter sp. ANJX3]MBB5358218.1 putative zinc-type alcohol dehydrogenase-like protein [Rhodanobacter sp. ANJX3]
MLPTLSYAASSAKAPLAPYRFERRDPREHDVVIDILYCGVCHSDVHTVRDEWGQGKYPIVPGHEIIGRVMAVGKGVTKFKVGDMAGVGCMVDSCRECASCKEDLEQFCEKGATFTYASKDRHDGSATQGGYSSQVVVDEAFTLHISDKLDPAAAAPLLCAGITTYSPLKHWKVGKGSKVGVVGLGGLGHMALKLAHAFGATVVQFTTSESKRADALRLGADDVVLSNNAEQMKAHAGTFDFILDTVSAKHDLDVYLQMLKREGTMTLVGVPDKPAELAAGALIFGRRSLAGSLIGGIAETQEMLDFCAEHGIVSEIEKIDIQDINEAYERMLKSDVKYRFVIDMASLKKEAASA